MPLVLIHGLNVRTGETAEDQAKFVEGVRRRDARIEPESHPPERREGVRTHTPGDETPEADRGSTW